MVAEIHARLGGGHMHVVSKHIHTGNGSVSNPYLSILFFRGPALFIA